MLNKVTRTVQQLFQIKSLYKLRTFQIIFRFTAYINIQILRTHFIL